VATKKTKPSKLYVGKLFMLKNAKEIMCYDKSGTAWNTKKHELSAKQLGGKVMIIDEAAKRVFVLPTSKTHPRPVWISRFWLHCELREEIEGNPSGELSKVLTEMAAISSSLRNAPSVQNVGKQRDKLDKLIRRIRQVHETLETES